MLFISIINTNNNWSAQTNGIVRLAWHMPIGHCAASTSLNSGKIYATSTCMDKNMIEICRQRTPKSNWNQPTFRCDRIFFLSCVFFHFFLHFSLLSIHFCSAYAQHGPFWLGVINKPTFFFCFHFKPELIWKWTQFKRNTGRSIRLFRSLIFFCIIENDLYEISVRSGL